MLATKTPEILVIDHDVRVVQMIRTAAPAWEVHAAYDGPSGIVFVRLHRSALRLIVLDVSLPYYDGIKTCVQLRHDYPDLPIMPFTAADSALPILESLGCAQPLNKRLQPSRAQLTAALERAMAQTPEPLPATPLLSYLYKIAVEAEHAFLRQSPTSKVALLAALDQRSNLRDQIVAAGGVVCIESDAPSDILLRARQLAPQLLIAATDDVETQLAASTLARQCQVPLLIVAGTLPAAYHAIEIAHAVVVEPFTPFILQAAIASALEEDYYYDPALEAPFTAVGLNDKERAICIKLMQGLQTIAIADALNYQPQTVREYLSRIYAKFGIDNPSRERLRQAIESWCARKAYEVGGATLGPASYQPVLDLSSRALVRQPARALQPAARPRLKNTAVRRQRTG